MKQPFSRFDFMAAVAYIRRGHDQLKIRCRTTGMKNVLAERLKAARDKLKWRQEDLAVASGVPQQTISDIENGKSQSARDLPALAKALGVSTDHLLGVETDPFAAEVLLILQSVPKDRRERILKAIQVLAE